MRRVKSKNTSPELRVRRALLDLGHTGYRLHRKDIPGNPDIAWVGRKIAIFIHGCFWHGHSCQRGARVPKTRADYWITKIGRNKSRDVQNANALTEAGWRTLTVWECELRDDGDLIRKLVTFLGD